MSCKERQMALISRENFEEIVQRMSEETGVSLEKVRIEAEKIARLNGFQIEESTTISLIRHFQESARCHSLQ